MLDPTASGCINHPGIEASARCKQCSRPVCGQCVIQSPQGNFCSGECSDKFAHFSGRAEQMDQRGGGPRGVFLMKIRQLIVKLLILAAVVGLVVFGARALDFSFGDAIKSIFDWVGGLVGK